MTDIVPMPDAGGLPPNSNRPTKGGTDPDLKRRRLLQGGLASAPVLMTLVSKPVLAQQCQSPSGFVSGNASTATGARLICTGLRPEYWSQNTGSWPSPYSPTTPFFKVFGGTDQTTPAFKVFGGTDQTTTLLGVLENLDASYDVARLVVAALLNAQAGRTPVLTIRAIQHIWTEYSATRGFTPTAGAHWDHDEIVSYLLSTMPL